MAESDEEISGSSDLSVHGTPPDASDLDEMPELIPASEDSDSDDDPSDGTDGVRMTWNRWPVSNCVFPVAVSFCPLLRNPYIRVLAEEPIRCQWCSSIINPHCQVDCNTNTWNCPICSSNDNQLPDHFTNILKTKVVPVQIHPLQSTVEYAVPGAIESPRRPLFVFLCDTCLIKEELQFVRSAIEGAIKLLPSNSMIGFISFWNYVQVHELGLVHPENAYIFQGTKEVTKQQMEYQLGQLQGFGLLDRFFTRVSDCGLTLLPVLQGLLPDHWSDPGKRTSRCTGVALSVAARLLEACQAGTSARIIALVGGPCTEGPGMIVSKDLSEHMRSNHDLRGHALHFHKAVEFYKNLSSILVNQGHVLNIFACSPNQVGIAEMKVAVERTGGLVVLAESFGHEIFTTSFRNFFKNGERSLGLSFNGTVEIRCSKDIKIQGIIGPCASLEKKGPSCADTFIGEGNTALWKICRLDKSTYFTVFFDVSPRDKLNPLGTLNPQLYLQFLTNYQSLGGETRIRVTTVTRRWVDSATNSEELMASLDQETAIVVMARLISFKMEMEERMGWLHRSLVLFSSCFNNHPEKDATRWLDISLRNFSNRYPDYVMSESECLNHPSFLELMFHLRRSQFVQVSDYSPDETAYVRMLLNRESVSNSVLMLIPSLNSYHSSSDRRNHYRAKMMGALIDEAFQIQLLDAYLLVVIFYEKEFAKLRDSQDYAGMLEAVHGAARFIISKRFPVPHLVECVQDDAQARIFLAKKNPTSGITEFLEFQRFLFA